MIRFRFNSLQSRLIFLGILSVSIALVTACAGFMWTDWHTLHQAKRRELQTQAEIVGFNSAAVLLIGDAKAAEQLLAPLSAQPTIDAAALYAEDGRMLASYTAPQALPAPAHSPSNAGHATTATGDVEYVQSVVESGQRVGKLYLRANMDDLWRQTREHLLVALVVVAASSAAALPLAYLLALAISRPILDLARTADRITRAGDFSIRVQSPSKSEIGTLYRAFNDLLQHVDTSDRALKASQDELEQRVELRTAELQSQIRENERVQQDLITAKDVAEGASRAKSEFLANMSHEIRTPMNGVLGLTELVLDTNLSRDQRESMEMVKSSAEALMVVINDILDFSKIEAGKMELDPVEFVLGDLLGDAVKSLALRAHHKGLELSYDVEHDVPHRVIGDPGRLRQVLVNLVGNAIKFTERGEVTVEVRNAKCGMRNENPQSGSTLVSPTPHSEFCTLQFSVRDTGIGIPVEKQRVIFEAFSQADGSMTRKYGGTGLGLTISSQLVALMGGQLRVESVNGEGSTFHFSVRFQRPAATAGQADTRTAPNLTGMNVLVVDDNATNRRILEGTLRRWGARPTLVDGGRAALAALRAAADANEPFRLLLVDAMMPEMDGFSLIEQVRQQTALDRPTVMMLSSADSLGFADRCRQLGIDSYLVKPIKGDDLYSAITTVLRDSGNDTPSATDHSTLPSPPTHATATDHSPASVNILLAEDNPVNQRVAFRILTKRGYPVTIVGNGKEALAALAREPFDLVLMDIQMPEMDGFEATRAVRLEEAASGEHLPIIAMTAHAMIGDRERCLENGMDDYITKPIDPALLFTVIARNVPRIHRHAAVAEANGQADGVKTTVNVNQSPAKTPSSDQSPPFDLRALRAQLDNDNALVEEVIELFLISSPDMLREIQAAVADADCRRTERAAHSLKGASRNLAATACASAAEQLEIAGHSGKLDDADSLLATVQKELERLNMALEAAAGVRVG